MARGTALNRGEVWWARLPPPDKTRPVVLVSRQDAYARRSVFTVARVTTRVRGIRGEVRVGAREGVLRAGVANCDDLTTISRSILIEKVGALDEAKMAELDEALNFALGIE